MDMLFAKQVEKLYRSNLFIRNDNAYGVFYFGPDDFPGLQAEPYGFKSQDGHDLKGFFYYYENPIPGQLVVFDHGMGNGHRAYMREIEQLARNGFLVFSYDHTGCMASGGENTGGFAQSLKDLDQCISTLKAEAGLADRKIQVVGHSWGGFSTMNISAIHPEITHVVSMSGFVSVEMMIGQVMAGPMKYFRKMLLELERQTNPGYADFDARKSLGGSQSKVLLIYSENDPTVKMDPHFVSLQEALSHRENIHFLLVQGKGHNPSYTVDAVAYITHFFKELMTAGKKKRLVTPEQQKEFMAKYDWQRMTTQDEAVWKQIVDFLKN